MGVFKDGFKAVKGAKELGDYHGGMPSMRGSFKDIAKLTDDQGQGDILKHGVAHQGRGEGLPDAGRHSSRWASSSTCSRPRAATRTSSTTRSRRRGMKAPLSMGMEVPVKVMADDPMAVAVQWDALKGSIAASGGDMAVAMQGIQNTYAGTADAAGRAYLADKAEADAEAAAKVAANDPAERLKKLSQLKDAGLVSDEEFETKKAEILADL